MAEAFPSGLLDSVLKQLGSLVFQSNKLNFLLGIQLRNLRSKLELISGVIDDAELMAVLFPKFFQWVGELQRVLYEVNDLLDDALTRSMPTSDVVEMVRLRLSSLPFGLALAHKMKRMNKKIESVVEKCIECNLIVVEPSQPSHSSSIGGNEKLVARKGILRNDPDCAKDDEFLMIGRDDDKKKVIEMLFSNSGTSIVVAVIGGTGMGKTTLCRAVCNDAEIRNRFDVRLWVCLKGLTRFSHASMWREVIRKYGDDEDRLGLESGNDMMSVNRAQRKILEKGRILLVLDGFRYLDKSDTPIEFDWFELKFLVPTADYSGGKVLLTSSSTEPFDTIGFSNHGLDGLSEKHSWSLFEKMAFATGVDIGAWKIDLGKQIVSKCRGNPTLLRGVGTLLYGKECRDTWEYFASDFHFDNHYHNYIEVTEVSRVLPRCHQSVGYLSLFLQDEFKYDVLLDQLIAQEFSALSDKMQQALKDEFLCETGNVDNWDAKSLYMIIQEWENCVLQLARRESAAHGYVETDDIHEAARHISISRPSSSMNQHTCDITLPQNLIKDVIHRKSLLFLGEVSPVKMSVHTLDMLVSNLRYLRVLDLHDMALLELPSSIGHLIHLRYLDLSRNDFKELPDVILKLKNLQTLKLVYCDKLIRLPRHMENLQNLKHLHISMCLDLTHMPSRISKLTCLERLDRFIVSPHNGGLRYLKNLNNLKGHLSIELPTQWENFMMDAEHADLERKKDLTSLEFKWPGTSHGGDESDNYGLLDRLRPGTFTKKLFVFNFGGTRLPSWIKTLGIESLTKLTISQCKRCKTLPPFHDHSNIKSLALTSLNIEYLQDGVVPPTTSFFSDLKKLKIGKMPNLKGWFDLNLNPNIKPFPTIKLMEIWNCPYFTVTPPCNNDGAEILLQDVSSETLQLYDWSQQNLVVIVSFPSIVSLPNQFMAKCPSRLVIEGCIRLQMLWENKVEETVEQEYIFRSVQRLEHLIIDNCPEMKHLSKNLSNLMHLSRLEINKCSEELDCLYKEDNDGMPWKTLIWLKYLKVGGFQNLINLPKGLRHLDLFKKLEIWDCKALKWKVDSLPKLEHIVIKSCPQFSLRIEELKREYPNVEVLE